MDAYTFENMTEFQIFSPEDRDNNIEDMTVRRLRRLIDATGDETCEVYIAVLESYLMRRIAIAWRGGTMVYLPINNDDDVKPRRKRATKAIVGQER